MLYSYSLGYNIRRAVQMYNRNTIILVLIRLVKSNYTPVLSSIVLAALIQLIPSLIRRLVYIYFTLIWMHDLYSPGVVYPYFLPPIK